MQGDLDFWAILASLTLVGVAVGRLGLAGPWSGKNNRLGCFRAAVQLLAAGFVLGLAFESNLLPWVWTVGMILYSAETVRRRAAGDYRVRNVALASSRRLDGGEPIGHLRTRRTRFHFGKSDRYRGNYDRQHHAGDRIGRHPTRTSIW